MNQAKAIRLFASKLANCAPKWVPDRAGNGTKWQSDHEPAASRSLSNGIPALPPSQTAGEWLMFEKPPEIDTRHQARSLASSGRRWASKWRSLTNSRCCPQ